MTGMTTNPEAKGVLKVFAETGRAIPCYPGAPKPKPKKHTATLDAAALAAIEVIAAAMKRQCPAIMPSFLSRSSIVGAALARYARDLTEGSPPRAHLRPALSPAHSPKTSHRGTHNE